MRQLVMVVRTRNQEGAFCIDLGSRERRLAVAPTARGDDSPRCSERTQDSADANPPVDFADSRNRSPAQPANSAGRFPCGTGTRNPGTRSVSCDPHVVSISAEPVDFSGGFPAGKARRCCRVPISRVGNGLGNLISLTHEPCQTRPLWSWRKCSSNSRCGGILRRGCGEIRNIARSG
jgi:hypothetical protein